MDTHNASPKFNIGDKVRPVGPDCGDLYRGRIGIITIDDGDHRFPYRVTFADMDVNWFGTQDLEMVCPSPEPTPAPPLGVEAWRLLFRANRNGWGQISRKRWPDGLLTRTWLNENDGTSFSLTTDRPVR